MGFADDAYQPFDFLVPMTGLPVEKVNFVVCALAAYPLSVAFRTIPTSQASLRHAVGGLVGLAMCILCFRWETIHLVAHMLYTFVAMSIGGKKQQLIVFVGCMSHLMAAYLYHRFYFWGDYTLNVTGPLMVLTQKMTQLAFATHDGTIDADAVKPFCRSYVLKKQPTLLEIFGHTFFFPSVMVGPNHHFSVYKDLIEGTGPHQKPADGLVPGLKKLGLAFTWHIWTMLPGLVFGIYAITPHKVAAGGTYEGSENYVAEYGPVKKFLYNIMAMQIYRCGFYFAWLIAEGACNVAGLGYAGLDTEGKPRWDLVTNVRPYNVEFATNFKEVLDDWNIQTANWLRYVCYERLGKHQQPVYATMALSALWHGPYLGYYMTFFTAALVTEGNRKFRHNVRPHFMPEGSMKHKFYNVAGWFCNLFVLNYVVGPFVMLTVEGSIAFWSAFYWFMHIIFVVLNVVLPGKSRKPKKDEAKADSKKTE